MWPPTLDEMKLDMPRPDAGTPPGGEDARLQQVLDAAVAFVEAVHDGRYDFADESGADLPSPPADVRLGTIRLAVRWHQRRRTPDGMVQMADLGAGRVPGVDPDIERMLGIGRYAPAVVA